MIKIIKKVVVTDTILHRDAVFIAVYMDDGVIGFSVAILNPIDSKKEGRGEEIAIGRVMKLRKSHKKNTRLAKFTEFIPVQYRHRYLYSKGALEQMLRQFIRVKKRDLPDEIGLKWEHKEGDLIKELSIEDGNLQVDISNVKPTTDLSDAIDKGGKTKTLSDPKREA